MNSKEKLGMIIVLLCGAMWGLSGVLGEMLFRNSDITVEILSSAINTIFCVLYFWTYVCAIYLFCCSKCS